MGFARGLATVAATLVGLWLVLAAAAWLFQRQIIYLPDRATPTVPADVEEIALTTADGLTLTAWWVAPQQHHAAILVTPGNAGSRALRLPLAQGLADRGFGVLLLDYRGYGGNPGRPHEDGLLADALAARRHLDTRDDVTPEQIVYLGESIGTGVAAALTREAPPAALVLRSPFPSLADVGAGHYPFLPVRTLLRERFPALDDLAGWDGPTLVVAGDADRIVPTELSRAVADELAAETTWLDGVDHNDRALLDGDAYLDAVDRFVRSVLDAQG